MADLWDGSDWSEEDAAWERLQREGLTALDEGDLPFARRRIGEALAVARRHFQCGDPRLAASLASQATLLGRQDLPLAAALFRDALAQWGQALVWLARQPASRRLARSSSFHLRLESKHPGAYRERHIEDMRRLLALGRAHTEQLRDGSSEGDGAKRSTVAASDAERTFDAYRKVAAAVRFMPSWRAS
ncbi:MAG: hypothetical protein ACR2P3_13135 [Geminicoccaceae bacterium]